jgi:hypothetical protein
MHATLQEVNDTTSPRKNHAQKSERFNPLSLIRTDLPISRLVFEQRERGP